MEIEDDTAHMFHDQTGMECTDAVDNKELMEIIVDEELSTSSQHSLGDLKGVPLFKDDIDSLDVGNWLTDNIVVSFCRLLKDCCDAPIFSNLIILDSIFYLSLSSSLKKDSIDLACKKASSHFKEMHSSSVVVTGMLLFLHQNAL